MSLDVSDPEDGVASVTWIQTAGPVITWRTAGSYGIAFQTPFYEQAQSLSFRVTATDGKGASTSRDIVFSIIPNWKQLSSSDVYDYFPELHMFPNVHYFRINFAQAGVFDLVLRSYTGNNDLELYTDESMTPATLFRTSAAGGLDNDSIRLNIASPRTLFAKIKGLVDNQYSLVLLTRPPYLEEGFPVEFVLRGGGTYQSGPQARAIRIGNIDLDPQLEILLSSVVAGPIYAINHDGSKVPGWPLQLSNSVAYLGLGNVDGDPQDEISLGLGPFVGSCTPDRYLLDSDGSVMPGWPKQSCIAGTTTIPVMADLDKDGRDEILMPMGDIYKADGTNLRLDGEAVPPYPSESYALGIPSIADLNGDGFPDLVYSLTTNDNELRAYTLQRTLLPGFPASSHLDKPQGRLGPAGLADLNGDGIPEIVRIRSPGGVDPILNIDVVDSAGRQLWSEKTTTGPIRSELPMALGDITGDGKPEILIQTASELYAWQGNGSRVPGFPLTWGKDNLPLDSSPAIGDVTGDGKADIVIATQSAIRVYSGTGQPEQTIPLPSGAPVSTGPLETTVPAIADIDLDGRNEIVVARFIWNGYNNERLPTLWAFDLGGPPHGAVQWGQQGGSKRGTFALQPP